MAKDGSEASKILADNLKNFDKY
jgi:hypothetical protein